MFSILLQTKCSFQVTYILSYAFSSHIYFVICRSFKLDWSKVSSFGKGLTNTGTIFLPSHWLLSHITIIRTFVSDEIGIMTNDYHQSSERNWPRDQTRDLLFLNPLRYRLSCASSADGYRIKHTIS